MPDMKYFEFMNHLNSLKKFPILLSEHDSLHFTEMVTLFHIKRSQEDKDHDFNVKKVRKNLHVSQPAISQTISALEAKGLVQRHIDDQDRRKFVISLTDLGNQTIKQAVNRMDGLLGKILSEFSEDEVKGFISFTQKLLSVTKKVVDAE